VTPSPSSSSSDSGPEFGAAGTDAAGTDAATLAPPPGCPAHGLGPDGIRRLYGPEADNDPYGLYEKLRADHGPVAPVMVHGDIPAWLILGYRENVEAMRTPSRFSRDSRLWRELREGRVPADNPMLPIVAWQPMCSFVDGEEHERLRGAVTDSMKRFDRRGIRRHIIRYVDQLVDEFGPSGRAELVTQFAEHLPMLVMTAVVGMPDDYGPRLVQAARDLSRATETAIASNEYIVKTLRELVQKRGAPNDDFASWLVRHPAKLNDDEAVEHLRLVLVAAYETTANLIVNTLRTVLADPRYRASLSGGQMTLPEAVEQSLWDDPPFTTVYGRWATGDTELGGQRIKAGDMLILGLAAGNVDPSIRPDLSASMRGNRAHLAFSGGPHECPGQDIGRAVAEVGVDALLMRLPDLRLAVPEKELKVVSSLLTRHLTALPVEFTPVKPLRKQDETTSEVKAPAGTETVAEAPASQPEPQPVPAQASATEEHTSWWASVIRFLRGE
jgi:cytochrome P450